MYLVYSLLLTLGFIILLPRFVIDALSSGKYVTGLRQRLGSLPPINSQGKPIIWLHCVSVGETQAAQSLVQALGQEFPDYSLAVSTTTVTGQAVAQKLFGDKGAAVFYFPIDWAWTVRRTLSALKPSAVLIMETEIWPQMLRECRARKIPVALVNGRLSQTSFRRYRLIRPFMRRALNELTAALMQSEADAERIRQLGIEETRLKVTGNLKFDSAGSAIDEGVTHEIRKRFAFDGARRLIVAASTHAPEERVIVEAFKLLNSRAANGPRLLIAPRHPERFKEVADLLESSGLSWSQRSRPPKADDDTCEAILLDTIGELRAVYSLAEIVFVGGSIASHGGHNLLEPSAAGVCVVTGPHTQNFAAVTKALLADAALIQLPDTALAEVPARLAAILDELLSDETRRGELGKRAQDVCRRNEGATIRTLQALSGILSTPTAVDAELSLSALSVTTVK